MVSGLACVVCGLLQGVHDPGLQALQVKKLVHSGLQHPFIAGSVSCGQVRSFHLLLHCLPLHRRAVPNNCEEPGGGDLLLGGKDRRDHRSAS